MFSDGGELDIVDIMEVIYREVVRQNLGYELTRNFEGHHLLPRPIVITNR